MIRFAAFRSVECANLVIAKADGAILHGDLSHATGTEVQRWNDQERQQGGH